MFSVQRGCVACVRQSGGSSGTGYRIDGLSTRTCPPIIITGVNPSSNDIVQPLVTMDGKKIVYVFGESIGDIVINGEALLGPNAAAGTMDRVVDFFRSRRLSSGGGSKVNVSAPGGAYKVWITGMGLGSANAEFNTLPFTLTGLIAEPP